MAHPRLIPLAALLLLAGAASASPGITPPGLAAPEANLLPTLDAPTQAEKTPGLQLLHQMFPKQVLRLGGDRVVIDLDGTIEVSPAYGILSIRFGFHDHHNYQTRQWFESTFEERATMSLQHRQAALEFALADLPNYLDLVWATTDWSPQTKRRILFELWDEAMEGQRDEFAKGGEIARRTIESYIRYRLPTGSMDAFSRSELEGLNGHRESAQTFTPYQKRILVPAGTTFALLSL